MSHWLIFLHYNSNRCLPDSDVPCLKCLHTLDPPHLATFIFHVILISMRMILWDSIAFIDVIAHTCGCYQRSGHGSTKAILSRTIMLSMHQRGAGSSSTASLGRKSNICMTYPKHNRVQTPEKLFNTCTFLFMEEKVNMPRVGEYGAWFVLQAISTLLSLSLSSRKFETARCTSLVASLQPYKSDVYLFYESSLLQLVFNTNSNR